jgi:tripartite-type tricarboxylate transporter receptor subunit TctC
MLKAHLLLQRWQGVRMFAAVLMCFSTFLGVTAIYGQDYPSQPIRLIVPHPPGGGTDLVARLLGQKIRRLDPARASRRA